MRVAAVRRWALTLDHLFSMGFRSGESLGMCITFAPVASIAAMTSGCLWLFRLSMITMSSGPSCGARS